MYFHVVCFAPTRMALKVPFQEFCWPDRETNARAANAICGGLKHYKRLNLTKRMLLLSAASSLTRLTGR
jgi:hypothetical protein